VNDALAGWLESPDGPTGIKVSGIPKLNYECDYESLPAAEFGMDIVG
jgi:hypothetical protein